MKNSSRATTRNQGGRTKAARRQAAPASLLAAVFAALLAIQQAASAQASSSSMLLLRRTGAAPMRQLVEISAVSVTHRNPGDQLVSVPIDECVALMDSAAVLAPRRRGMIFLADGQRLPGEALSAGPGTAKAIVWNHPMLGRLEVPLKKIQAVVFRDGIEPPQPDDRDVVLLVNGDRVEGVVTSLGDPLMLDVSQTSEPQLVEIQMDRVSAVGMVVPRAKPQGRRVWLTDGTVLDASQVLVGDDGLVRLVDPPLLGGERVDRLPLQNLAAVLFHPGQLMPLSQISPRQVTGPPTRYQLPDPAPLTEPGALGLADMEFRGPLTVRYSLSKGSSTEPVRLIAEVSLPPSCRTWGDCELVILDDDAEVFRQRINGAHPQCSINVSLAGRGGQLTIQITPGAHGPIQDRLVFTRSMLLSQQ